MRRDRFWKGGLLAMMMAGLALTGRAMADDKHSGNTKVPSYSAYPRGKNLRQAYSQPPAGIGSMAAFNAAPGGLSPSASMSALYQQDSTRKLVAKDFLVLPGSSAQIRLGGTESGLLGGPQVIHKFSYGLQYKDVVLSKHTSQGLVIASRGNQRKLLFSRDRNLPDTTKLPADTKATVKQEAAVQVGLDDAKRAVGEMAIELSPGEANVAPHLEIVVGEAGQSNLAWTYVVRAKDRKDRFARQYWIAAQGDPRVVIKEDLIYLYCPQAAAPPTAPPTIKAAVTGNIFGMKKSPLDPPDNRPLQDYQAQTNGNGQSVTDASGQYTQVSGPTINLMLMGPYARVVNEGGTALLPQESGGNLDFRGTSEQELAQVSAFYWVNFAHEFVLPFLPGSPSRLVNNELHVNINDTCNAFWNGADNTLNFFKSGGGCVNSAFCDVVCHEFGHGVDAEFGDILDAAYSEGFGDSLAILITQDNIIGRDFLGKDKPLRNAADLILWPDVMDDFDPHTAGQPYAGFTWELTRQLLTKFSGDQKKAFDTAKQLTLGAAALNPSDVPDAVRLVFFVDHQNGSKCFDELAKAADSRKIPRPANPAALNNAANLNPAGNGH
jgi:hypothetical protein